MATIIDFKRGDTFILDCDAYEEDEITVVDLTGYSIRSQIRTSAGELVASASTADGGITITDALAGEFTIDIAAPTTGWPVKLLNQDIKYTDSGNVISSTDTLYINVLEGSTRDN